MNLTKIKLILSKINDHVKQAEVLGIRCSKRNGKADDPNQKKAIDLATKIGMLLVKNGHYEQAYNVCIPLCNMTMGPRKSEAAIKIAKYLINKNQVELATNIALLVAPLKGNLKIKTAKLIAKCLKEQNFEKHYIRVVDTLKKNPSEMALSAIKELESGVNLENLRPKDILLNINKFVKEAEALGIRCSKRNGKAEDPKQKKAIDLTTKIGSLLVKNGHYNQAYNVCLPLCNMTMGPRKSAAAITIATHLISQKQAELACKMALLVAPLKGALKIKTATKIAIILKKSNFKREVNLIYDCLSKNTSNDAKKAVIELKNIDNETKKNVTFIDSFHLKNEYQMSTYSKEKEKNVQNFQFLQKVKNMFNQKLAEYSDFKCQTHQEINPEIILNINKKKLNITVNNNLETISFDWDYDNNALFKNNIKIKTGQINEVVHYLNEFVVYMKEKKVDYFSKSKT